RVRDLSVQTSLFSGQHVVLQRLAQQRVTKRVSVAVDPEYARRHGVAQMCLEVGRGQVARICEEPVADAASADRHQAQQVLGGCASCSTRTSRSSRSDSERPVDWHSRSAAESSSTKNGSPSLRRKTLSTTAASGGLPQ